MNEWEVSSMKYMGKRLNEKGSGSVTILGTQLNKMLYLATPRMMTWGIADYVDESGKSNEKYTISLAFGQTMSKEEDEFLRKLKELENKILEDAVSNSELWWGEPMTKEVLKHMYFPFLKYPKVKGTKRDDMSKPPTLRAKLPYYNGQWGESFAIFSDKKEKLFPGEGKMSPVDLIPKMSRIACVIQIAGLWFGGKGWGLTIRASQAVVSPSEMRQNINDMCQIDFGEEQEYPQSRTQVEDSDEEEEAPAPVKAPVQVKAPEPVPEPVSEPVKAPASASVPVSEPVQVKAPASASVPLPVQEAPAPVQEAPAAAPKKKIVKKASS